MLAALLFGGARTADAFLGICLLTVLAFLAIIALDSRRGVLTRESASDVAVAGMASFLIGGVIWAETVLGGASLARANLGWVFMALVVGGMTCLSLSGQRLKALGVLAWTVVVILFLNPFSITRHAPGDLRDQLAGFDLDVSDLKYWEQAGALHHALAASGAETPDMDDVAQRVKAAMRSGADVHPRVWTVTHQMGLLDETDWQGLAQHDSEAHKLRQLRAGIREVLKGDPPRGLSRTTYQQYVLPMLLANQEVSGELDGKSLEALGQIVLALWPETGDHGALEQANACVHLLDLLGREDLIGGLRPSALRMLEEHWISGKDLAMYGQPGGFSPQPAEFKRSMDGATWDGVNLMARFGAPESVNLDLLRGYLLHESRASRSLGDSYPYLRAKARGALLRLETAFEFPSRSPRERLADQRLLLGVLLLVIICIVTVARQPASSTAS